MSDTQTICSKLVTTTGAAVALRGVEIGGDVLGTMARIAVRQHYENTESKPVEAIYTFPLPADATLVGFTMTSGGRTVEGIVQEREEAFRTYDDAIVQGHGAALLEQERPNVFTANVGNLLPGEETLIEVTYLQRLTCEEGALRLCVPTLVAPRYIPGPGDLAIARTGHGTSAPTAQVTDADRISPEVDSARARYGLTVDLKVTAFGQVISPSHAISTERFGLDGLRLRLAGPAVSLDRDLVLLIEGLSAGTGESETEAPIRGALVEGPSASDPDGTLAISIVPDFFAEAQAVGGKKPHIDVVFLLDRSGSMEGDSMVEARRALSLCLRQLREGDRFNILAFDTAVESFSDHVMIAERMQSREGGKTGTLIPFTQTSLQRADSWLAAVHARGGTELLAPLLSAVQIAGNAGIVVLLTDGQVGNEDEIASAVLTPTKPHSSPPVKCSRIYSFGIGLNVSEALLRRLARESRGAVSFIYPGERIDDKVVSIFSKAIAPRVTDIRVRAVDLALEELTPGETPDLVDGDPWTLFARWKVATKGTVEISGLLAGQPYQLTMPVDLSQPTNATHLGQLWAAERVRDFEAMELTGRRADAMKDRIVGLGKKFGIATKFTSFVVVDRRQGDRVAVGMPEARPVPVHAAATHAAAIHAQSVGSVTRSGSAAQFSLASLGGGMSSGAKHIAAPGGMPMPPPSPSPRMSAPMPAPMVESAKKKGGLLRSLFNKAMGRSETDSKTAAEAGPVTAREECAKDEESKEYEAGAEMDLYAEDNAVMPSPQAIESEPSAKKGHPSYLVDRLTLQQAGGLFGTGSDVEVLTYTCETFGYLLAENVTTSHPLYGEQVRKAIEAVVALAKSVATSHKQTVEKTLAIALLLATGRRTRKLVAMAIVTILAGSRLAVVLEDETAVRKIAIDS